MTIGVRSHRGKGATGRRQGLLSKGKKGQIDEYMYSFTSAQFVIKQMVDGKAP